MPFVFEVRFRLSSRYVCVRCFTGRWRNITTNILENHRHLLWCTEWDYDLILHWTQIPASNHSTSIQTYMLFIQNRHRHCGVFEWLAWDYDMILHWIQVTTSNWSTDQYTTRTCRSLRGGQRNIIQRTQTPSRHRHCSVFGQHNTARVPHIVSSTNETFAFTHMSIQTYVLFVHWFCVLFE